VSDAKRILWHLNKVNLLADLGPEILQRLAERVELRDVRRRDVVYLPGDPGDTVFLLNSGRIKISKVTRDGKALTLSYVGAGELFGETSLVDGSPREEMAEAMENSTLTVLDRVEAESLLKTSPGFGYQLSRILLTRRRELENKLEALVFRDVTSKLAELLLQLSEEHGVEDSRGILVALKITHQELANLIGSTRETVSLTLSQFKKKNYITTEGRKVIISDAEGLRALF